MGRRAWGGCKALGRRQHLASVAGVCCLPVWRAARGLLAQTLRVLPIEAKAQQIADLGAPIAQTQAGCFDAQAAIIEYSELLAGLTTNCASEIAEREERPKLRAALLVALPTPPRLRVAGLSC